MFPVSHLPLKAITMRLEMQNIIQVLGVIMIIFTMLIVAYFQLKSAPLILWRIWKDAFSDFFNIFA